MKGKSNPELLILIHMGLSTEMLIEKGYKRQKIYAYRHRYNRRIKPMLLKVLGEKK